MNENVEDRTPDLPIRLPDVASQLLDEAREADSGHAALTLTPHPGGSLKQTLVAVRSGQALDPDQWNGPASVQVVSGSAVVTGSDDPIESGGWTVIPESGEVRAEEDLVALLTVAPDGG